VLFLPVKNERSPEDQALAEKEKACPNEAGPNRPWFSAAPERFQAKWRPVRVKKTRQIKNLEPRFDSIETERLQAGVDVRLPRIAAQKRTC
jgi:hypothetical protein